MDKDDITASAKRDFEEAASRARSVANKAGENVSETADSVRTVIDRSLHDQPTATLAMAVGLGFVVGALWKR